MTSLVTRGITISLALLFGAFLWVGSASAQVTELGDEFVFFVDGTNVLVPEFQGESVNDPLDPGSGNKVAKFSYGNWAAVGFRFSRTEGVDLTQNVSETVGEGDTLYLSLLVDPLNAGKPGLTLSFLDKTDDSPANDGTADLEFRLQWPIAEELRDGMWHDLAIPLPPSTSAALDSAKVGLKTDGSPLDTPLDEMAALWTYPGAWSGGGFGVGPGFGTSTEDPLWKEFEWDGVNSFTVFFDTDQGGGPIYVDNLYIGGPGTDLSAAGDPPSAMSGVSFSPDGTDNVISWTHNAEYGGYNVYVSEEPITSVGKSGQDAPVVLLATVPFNADAFEVRHQFEVPHPSLAPFPLYYAVTSLSVFGTENADVSASAGEIANDELPIQSSILVLTDDEGEAIFNNLAAGEVTGESFPDVQPFVINQARSQAGDAPLPDDDTDFSAEVWLGLDATNNELFAYAEVVDDAIEFGGENNNGTETWQFDSMEMGWGSYDVRDIPGGSILLGSPQQDYARGDYPDYQFRMSAFDDAAGTIIGTSTFFSNDPAGNSGGDIIQGEFQGGGSAVDILTDDGGNPIGWKILSLLPLTQIAGTEDVVFAPPASNELKLIPFTITFNDADGSGRESQAGWSLKSNFGANWWNTPAQWPSVAVVGRGLATGVEDEPGEVPATFALDQNYPNPFNPETTIRFSLAASENVSLSIYNVLGQRVATLMDGKTMTAGQHSVRFDASDLASGVYLYRLEAGTSFVQTKRMLLIK